MTAQNSPFTGPDALPVCIPDRSPLFKPLPRRFSTYRKLSVFARGNPDGIRKAIPPEFEPASDIVEYFFLDYPVVHDMADQTMGPRAYTEGGVVLSVTYKGMTGGHVAYAYLASDADDAICGGREVFGYPKKGGEVEFVENGATVEGKISRRGRDLMTASFTADGSPNFDRPVAQPRYQVKRIPRIDGGGYDVNQVVTIQGANAEIHEQRFGKATISLGGDPHMDPIFELGANEVVGAEYVTSSFDLVYGRVLEDLLKA
jgi:acetoacetate decarboxylase